MKRENLKEGVELSRQIDDISELCVAILNGALQSPSVEYQGHTYWAHISDEEAYKNFIYNDTSSRLTKLKKEYEELDKK